jgi:endonuclease/exonuclease/phosphatase family metal-dependent hydrolase
VEDVAKVVARLSLDVLGLVEVQEGALNRLSGALATRGFDTGIEVLDGPGSQDLAILFDRDTTTIERFRLSPRHRTLLNKQTSTGHAVFPRSPFFARCNVQEEDGRNVEFMFVLVHLKAFGDAISRERRREAARILAQIISELRESEQLSVVLTGDFNERVDTDVLQALKDSPDLVTTTADDATNGSLSFIGPNHRSLIDHIIVSKDARLGSIVGDDTAIVRLDKSVQDFADRVSDHVPLVMRMVFRPAVVAVDGPVVTESGLGIAIPPGAQRLEFSFADTNGGTTRQHARARRPPSPPEKSPA